MLKTNDVPMRMFSPSRLLLVGPLALALLLTGCKGWSVSQCVSPRVTGRVLDGETRQPLERAEVQRVGARPHRPTDEPVKGGQLMQNAPRIVLTSADGAFTLDAVYSVAAFQVLSWSSVNVQFRHAGYLALTTNFATALVTSDSGGEPSVNAGDILLRRKPSSASAPSSP
jgi:hypothetical protein